MKLTTETLKKLIREEIQKISEAIPKSYSQTGEIQYSKGKLNYYVFPQGQPNKFDVEGYAAGSLAGHYRVNAKRDSKFIPQGRLYLAIDGLIRKKDPQDQNKYDYVVGIEDKDMLKKLEISQDILPDLS